MSEADLSAPEFDALIEQLKSGAKDWADPQIPRLLSWLRAGQCRSQLQGLLRATATRLHTLTPVHARLLIELLIELDAVALAYALSATAELAQEPEIAALRARLALQLHDYPAAVAASEIAIAALLQRGLTIDELLRRCVAGAPAEGMLRVERHVLADRRHLSERLAVRWEALHRAGMTREASLMQLMCQRYFPERASVWATAGNHALDADDLTAAAKYFERCLMLDAHWTAALAGLAIVHERRKDWAAALPYRRRVVELEGALQQSDAASLQRRIRYAAALARVGQWHEAEPLFRSAARAPALAQLPAEHPVLLRVFSQELYAPALVSALLAGSHAQAAHASAERAAGARAVAQPEAATTVPALGPHDHAALRRLQAASASALRPNAAGAAQPAPGSTASFRPLQAAHASAKRTPGVAGGAQPAPHDHAALRQLQAARAASAADASAGMGEAALTLALHEAALLRRLQLTAARGDAQERGWGVALCAYLSGELEQAFALLDRVELERPEDLALHYLLWRCASAIAHEQAASIRRFAEEAARAYWVGSERAPTQLAYAVAILPELGAEVRAAGVVLPTAAPEPDDTPLLTGLERLALFRALHEAAGHPPLAAAAASTHALAALVSSPGDQCSEGDAC